MKNYDIFLQLCHFLYIVSANNVKYFERMLTYNDLLDILEKGS